MSGRDERRKDSALNPKARITGLLSYHHKETISFRIHPITATSNVP